MSHATARQPSSTGQPSLDDLVGFGFKLLSLSIDTLRTVVQEAPRLLPQSLDATPSRGQSVCEIPETECPPRCICDVTWEATLGETPSLTVRVTNSGGAARSFQLHATPFAGPVGSPGTIKLAPASLNLQPGNSGIVDAKFTVPNKTLEGDYRSEIIVTGAYEQCVRVLLKVRCKKTCGDEHCFCDVVQGDPPVRIRAHHWYDHFQCIEPCVDPRYVKPDHDQ